MIKEKKIKTITKTWQINTPSDEDVDDFIRRIQESCSNMKKDFPNFLSYRFFIDFNAYLDYGDSELDLTMQCTHYETDTELQTRVKRSEAATLRAKQAKIAKENLERGQLAKLKEKYE